MRRFDLVSIATAAVAIACSVFAPASGQEHARPTLISNAMVLDGTGAAARRADVRIVADRIVEVGQLAPSSSDRVVDAHGLTLAPGFIDTHSHASRGLFEYRDALADVSQGITTVVVGQDGGSTLPLAEYFARLKSEPPAVNVASYAGHGTIRHQVMGDDFKRTATPEEVRRMEDLLRTEMAAGALGLSTGLEYDPGIYSAPSEVVALAKVAAASGGRYISHIRSEDRTEWQAIDEIIAIGREARLPVQISHMKLAMRGLWGQADKLIQVLDRARAQNVDITADIYPYTYWQSTITVLFPKREFADRTEAEFVLKEVVAPEDLLITRFEPEPAYAGKTLAQIAALRNTPPAVALMDVIKIGEDRGASAGVIATSMDERDVARLLQWRFANVCTDGELAGAHPRGYGSFPRVLGRYVREQRVLTLPDAIRKMTSLAAANVGLADRGVIAPNKYADLVLFDPATVADRATTAEPRATSVGIDTVWVNGDVVFRDGNSSGAHPGRVLLRSDK
jgi:N-acyl-D-amino-acid deacylase